MNPAVARVRWWDDARVRALVLIAILVAAGGALVHWLPREVTVVSPPAAEPHQPLVDRHFQQGVMMLHAKQYEHAVTAFHQVLRYAPQMPEAHVNMGFALIGMKKHDVARDFFNSATELRPSQANAYYGLGESLQALGDLEGAIGAMRTFVHLAPPDDKFRRRAESAIWEMTEARNRDRSANRKVKP